MDLQLIDKVALVTAASRGLGKAAARQLAREGARVTMCARSEILESAANEIRQETKAEIMAVRADVTKEDDISHLVKTTLDRFGRIDILITNAGGPPSGNFLTLTPKDWETAVEITLMSTVRLCYAVVPTMLAQESGSIVANQSYSVKQPIDNLILSNSIRLSVIGMIKSLANELGPRGIRANSINPGWTQTERVGEIMAARAERSGLSTADESAKIIAEIPLGRMGTVEEYGRAIAWLASPAASYINGHALIVDGGIVKSPL